MWFSSAGNLILLRQRSKEGTYNWDGTERNACKISVGNSL
jgi:hypothetical protein